MHAYALTCAGDVLRSRADATGSELLRSARTIIDRCVDPGIARSRLAAVEARHGVARPSPLGLVEELTDREAEVLRYLATALSQREIAAQLFVSLNTVKSHCSAIYRKLGVADRSAAVQAARDLEGR